MRVKRRIRYFLFKIYALFSLVRWYNIIIISIALYLSALYLFNIGTPHLKVLADYRLHLEVIALALFIMSGYIINAFYDYEKDMINDPDSTIIDRLISKEFSLKVYFGFNALGSLMSLFVSIPVFITNVAFISALWLYSHKMNKKLVLGELAASVLTILPFVSLSIYYHSTNRTIIVYFFFMGLMIYTRELVKKLIAIKGDLLLGNESIPIVFGLEKSKKLLFSLFALTIITTGPVFFHVRSHVVHIYLIMVCVIIIFNTILILRSKENIFLRINTVYKILLIVAILCIPFLFA